MIATLAYNVLEASIALGSGVTAQSIALVGFGLDSVIETLAAGFVLWHLRLEARGAHPSQVEGAERRVHRVVGGTFLAFALYVVGQAGWMLWHRHEPSESLIGIVLAIKSLTTMPLVALGKFRVARALGSTALRAEANETLACSYLSLTLLLGLVANLTSGCCWADPVASLCMVPWPMKEGAEGLRGE